MRKYLSRIAEVQAAVPEVLLANLRAVATTLSDMIFR